VEEPWNIQLPGGLLGPGRFIGREAELALLRRELAPGGAARLLTITGAGGMGKTRLAIEAARELLEPFAGAVAFVPLADLTAASEIPRAIAEALRLPPAPGLDPLVRVTEELSKRPSLLVLDNLEHLVAESAKIVRALLAGASGLRCLATSRQRLGLEGERGLPLEPLPLPGTSLEPERLVEAPSVRLFAECARAVQPDFHVTRTNAGAVSELVRRLEGIPLALALAGRRARAFSLEQMLVRLSEHLDLPAGRGETPSRHRTLRAVMDCIHATLSPERQRFFARLSVFRGGFSVEAVEKICEEPAALEELIALRDGSLVVAELEAPEPRFRMLETLREFARDQLSSDELASLERHHAEHFRGLAASSAAALDGPDHPRILGRLLVDLDNMRAALDWSADDRSRSETELELCASLWRVWELHGPAAEGRRRCSEALERSRGATSLRLRTLIGATTLASHQGDHREARSLAETTLATAEKVGDRPGILRALVILGGVETVAGSTEEARGHYEAALALARELGDRTAVAGVLLDLGSLFLQRGEPLAARRHLEESLSVSGTAQPLRTAQTLCELGVATLLSGDDEPSREHLEKALAAFRALPYPPGVAAALRHLAHAAERGGNLERARSLLEESLAEARGKESWVGAQRALSLAGLARVSSPSSRSRELLGEAAALARKNELMRDHVEAAIAKDLADLHRREGDALVARTAYGECLARLASLAEKTRTASCLEGLAALDRAEGKTERAAELLAAAASARKEIGAPPAPAEATWLASERDALREALGRRAFDRAWRSGGALELEDAVTRALEE
jgi:non-specific serine/threonine protein kinase